MSSSSTHSIYRGSEPAPAALGVRFCSCQIRSAISQAATPTLAPRLARYPKVGRCAGTLSSTKSAPPDRHRVSCPCLGTSARRATGRLCRTKFSSTSLARASLRAAGPTRTPKAPPVCPGRFRRRCRSRASTCSVRNCSTVIDEPNAASRRRTDACTPTARSTKPTKTVCGGQGRATTFPIVREACWGWPPRVHARTARRAWRPSTMGVLMFPRRGAAKPTPNGQTCRHLLPCCARCRAGPDPRGIRRCLERMSRVLDPGRAVHFYPGRGWIVGLAGVGRPGSNLPFPGTPDRRIAGPDSAGRLARASNICRVHLARVRGDGVYSVDHRGGRFHECFRTPAESSIAEMTGQARLPW